MDYRTYRSLIVWQKAMQLAVLSYRSALRLPALERFGLAAQMRKAAASIPANIAEGSGRRARGDYARFLAIARGSAYELETHFDLAIMVGYLEQHAVHETRSLLHEVIRMLTAMLRKLAPLGPRT